MDRLALFVRKARALSAAAGAMGAAFVLSAAAYALAPAPIPAPEPEPAKKDVPAPNQEPPKPAPTPDKPSAPENPPTPDKPSAPENPPAPDKRPAPEQRSAPEKAPAAPAPPPPSRDDQKSNYGDFRTAYDGKRYDLALPLAQRAVAITEQLDGADSVELVTPLNNLAQTSYLLKDYAAAEENYLRSIKIIETHAARSVRLPHTLYGLGRVYVAAGQMEFAIAMFRRAVDVTRKDDGLFSASQLPFLLPLIDAYAKADRKSDADREEQYLVSIAERNFSPQSAQYISAVERQAAWQEALGKYLGARRLYAQAIELTRRATDAHDIRQVNQMRGIARTYRKEYQYGAADTPAAPDINDGFQWGGAPAGPAPVRRLDPEGETMLKNALGLLQNANGPAGQHLKRDTLIDLGDWQWIGGDSAKAAENYGAAWDLSTASEREPGPDSPLASPQLLFYVSPRAASKNPKAKADELIEKTVETEFPVSADGRVGDIKVVKSNASESQQRSVLAALHKAFYRPRLADRKFAATEGVKFTETIYAKK